jgi:hypothetical protein
MKIGVAIPCYKGHIEKLFDLLDSIEKQTRVPDKVVVSCSSTDDFTNCKEYNFSLEIVITSEKKNAAQNRNIAISRLTNMDYITFIDADDIMHFQRIEILLKVFQDYDSDIILHNFLINNNEFKRIEDIQIKHNSLTQCESGCLRHKDFSSDLIYKIHHSQPTLKRYILDKIQFPEETEFNRREDSVFCHRVFGLENIKNTYIMNELSYYSPSNTEF